MYGKHIEPQVKHPWLNYSAPPTTSMETQYNNPTGAVYSSLALCQFQKDLFIIYSTGEAGLE